MRRLPRSRLELHDVGARGLERRVEHAHSLDEPPRRIVAEAQCELTLVEPSPRVDHGEHLGVGVSVPWALGRLGAADVADCTERGDGGGADRVADVAALGHALARARAAVRAADLATLRARIIGQGSEEAAGSLAVGGGDAGLGPADRSRCRAATRA